MPLMRPALQKPSPHRTAVRLLVSLGLSAMGGGCGPASPPASTSGEHRPQRQATAAAPDIRFVDISKSAGIHFVHQSAKTKRKYMIETMGSGCAFLDYDGDGSQDILLLNNAPLTGGAVTGTPRLALYHNNHNGTFTDVTAGSGLDRVPMYAMGVAVGDYDNDGRDDIYISCVLGPGHLFHNEGHGRFRDVTQEAGVANRGAWGTSCMWVDYDRDGLLDLFVCNYVPYRSLADDVPCYAGEPRRNIYCVPKAYRMSRCTLYHNEGRGRFKDGTQTAGLGNLEGRSLGVAMWDNTGSGWPDLFVANDDSPTFLLTNGRNGAFKENGTETGIAYMANGSTPSGMGIDAEDLYNDGSVCLVMSNFQGRGSLLFHATQAGVFMDEGNSSGIGQATTNVLGFGVFACDFDNDGWKDILQVDGHVDDDVAEREPGITYAQPTLLLRNMGDHRFTEVGLKGGAPFDHKIVGRGAAWGDIDNDGRPDVLILQNDGPALLWHNETPPKNHWATFKLIGVKSNRDGIGAMVTVTTPGTTQRTM
ncbi:MAG: ASPIC/UnbV domain protein, partial [Chthonomonadales bacterium]|nr:ASPIC/UnbV domain protein [Chthonomonadales bacterium]